MRRTFCLFGLLSILSTCSLADIPNSIKVNVRFAANQVYPTKVTLAFFSRKSDPKPLVVLVPYELKQATAAQLVFPITTQEQTALKPLESVDGFYVQASIDGFAPQERIRYELRGNTFIDVAPPSVDSESVKIYSQLAAGFGYTPDAGETYYSELKGTTYELKSRKSSSTVSTSLTGLVSIAIRLSDRDTIGHALRDIEINAVGVTFGTGIQASTAGSADIAPFMGFSFFFGNNNTAALTFGLQWVPQIHTKNFNTVTGQFNTYNTYGPGRTFVGITYRIGGA